MTPPTFHDVLQGTDEWHALRRGMLTASEMHLILTPTYAPANNATSRGHMYELLAQRITGYTEPHYIGDDMLRGHEDEVRAKRIYSERYAPVTAAGFVTREFYTGNGRAFTIGFSPDGLVGDDGLVECKSRRAKHQIATVLEVAQGVKVPREYMVQIQTGLLVTGRRWCDFVSYSGGLHLVRSRVMADVVIQDCILAAAAAFEADLALAHLTYENAVAVNGWPATKREENETEIVL